MVTKILSGAYNDVERGALDFALDRGIPHGGWAPLNWLAKSDLSPQTHGLQEVPHSGSPNYAERNIFDADGTLLITNSGLSGAAELAQNFAARYRHPLVHIDLSAKSRFRAAEEIAAWVSENGIYILYVTGGGPDQPTGLYQVTRDILETVFHLNAITDARSNRDRLKAAPETALSSRHPVPGNIDAALKILTTLLSLKEKARIGRTAERDLQTVYSQLGHYIAITLGWWKNNDALITSCRAAATDRQKQLNSPDQILIHSLWLQLRQAYNLRVIR